MTCHTSILHLLPRTSNARPYTQAPRLPLLRGGGPSKMVEGCSRRRLFNRRGGSRDAKLVLWSMPSRPDKYELASHHNVPTGQFMRLRNSSQTKRPPHTERSFLHYSFQSKLLLTALCHIFRYFSLLSVAIFGSNTLSTA